MDTTTDNSSQLNFPMPFSYLTTPPNIKDVTTHDDDEGFTWKLRDYIFVATESVVGLLVIIINVLIILVMIRYRSLRTNTNAYIASLVVADLLVGLVVPPFATLTRIHLHVGYVPCVLMVTLPCMFIDISVFNLVSLACDRYVAVQHPLFHRRMVTTKQTMVCIAVSWLIGTIPSLINLFFQEDHTGNNEYCSFGKVTQLSLNVYIYLFGFFTPIFVAMFILHMRIFFAFRAANKRRAQGMVGTPMANSPHIVSRARRKEVKLFKSLALMFSVFLLCFMPIQIANAVEYYRPDIKRPKAMTLSLVILQHSSSFINPLMYAMGQVSIRRMIGVGVPPCFFRLCELKPSDSVTTVGYGKKHTVDTHHYDETTTDAPSTMMESSSQAKTRFHLRRHTILWDDPNLDTSMTPESGRTNSSHDEEHGSKSLPEPHALTSTSAIRPFLRNFRQQFSRPWKSHGFGRAARKVKPAKGGLSLGRSTMPADVNARTSFEHQVTCVLTTDRTLLGRISSNSVRADHSADGEGATEERKDNSS